MGKPKPHSSPKAPILPAFYYSSVIFTSSFLLFLLEPLYAKLILPWFGGAASVWALCLVFFQSSLLVGYWYADFIIRRLRPLTQSILHIGLLLASLWFVPITPHSFWRPHPGEDPTWLILGLLATSIGLPFILLSSTGPLIQVWYSRNFPEKKPYFLFALSNGASFFALISFTFLIEPHIPSSRQVNLWSGLFAFFIVLCSMVAWLNRKEKGSAGPLKRKAASQGPMPDWGDRLIWLGLSACGSMFLLSVTNQITQNVAPVPLLWVLPLSIYLLSFTLVFGMRNFYPRKGLAYLLPVALVFLNYVFYEPSFLPTFQLNIIVFCLGLFAACLFCHGELAARKPAPTHLTSFYLMVSLGGAVGALAVGLLAPILFSNVYELPLSLILTSGMAFCAYRQDRSFVRVYWGIIFIFLSLVLWQNVITLREKSLVMVRNFYAPLRVVSEEGEKTGPYLTLCNGVVVHGKQFLDPARSMRATTYYSRGSGVGLVLDLGEKGPKRVGVIGLGAGTMAVYGHPGDLFRFYEINPQVIQIAGQYFSFLRNSKARVELVPGDARLSLESAPPQDFDVLAVDAFSGDAIPVHLLTQEAFALYFRHLKPGGILAIHTSNLYLDLAPVVLLLADHFGYSSICLENKPDPDQLVDLTDWVIITKNKEFIESPPCQLIKKEIVVPAKLQLWTDDYNSLFTVFNQ